MFTVVGYDKDNGAYYAYGSFNEKRDAIAMAEMYAVMVSQDRLLSPFCEPIDWIEVYYEYYKYNDKPVWTSY